MSQDHELYVRDKNPSMDEIRPDPQHLLSLKLHWGLHRKNETLLFYGMIIPCWALEIAAAAMGPYLRSGSVAFIVCITLFFVLHWAAWFQTAFAMMQRSSWRRDEEAVEERVQFLWFAVRLQRMMLPTALIAFCTFIPAYVQRDSLDDLPYWLIFMLIFIVDTVGCVMNAYNNITWEADRLWFEDRIPGVPSTHVAIFGI
ncbi:hypothetical protein MBLNU13_g06729t1 [Cladosporium sp. NU13]